MHTMRIICDGYILVTPDGSQVEVDHITSVRVIPAESEADLAVWKRSTRPKRLNIILSLHGSVECEWTEEAHGIACEAHQLAVGRRHKLDAGFGLR